MEVDESHDNGGAVMTDEAQKIRRKSIREILADDSLTPIEKRRTIQSLMDGRRRSSNGTRSSSGSMGEMARAAAEAAEYYISDHEDDPMDGSDNNMQRAPSHALHGSQEHSNVDMATIGGGGVPHQRRERSKSLPAWSDNSMQAVAPLAAAASTNIWDDPINANRRMEKSRPACNHYERNCTIISPCCGLAFGWSTLGVCA